MRFLGVLFAWIAASVVAYLLGAAASSMVVLEGVRSVGRAASFEDRLGMIVHDWGAMYAYLVVILIGFAIAFFVADLIKSLVPALAGIAYPTAGAVAIVAALLIMRASFGVVPILGAQDGLGLWLQIGAGVIGGVVFELLRPKARDEVEERRLRKARRARRA